jgi:hypothetical protein
MTIYKIQIFIKYLSIYVPKQEPICEAQKTQT